MTTEHQNLIPLALASQPLTIGEMVAADYRKAEVFRKYGIDYCCGGKKPLEETCRKKGLDPQILQKELDALDQVEENPMQDFSQWPLDLLASHIVEQHHGYVATALPVLYELTEKVARVHGQRDPELLEIARIFNAMAQELQMHMHKEERILFPHIQRMEFAMREGHPLPVPMFGSVANPIGMMEAEHESAGGDMEAIRRLSNDYTPPSEACTSYRVLFAKLHEFEQDLHRHVHLENNILFPKAIALEKDRFAA